MAGKTVIYRGSIKSCNYRCSYCPFSKHRSLRGEIENDRESLFRFCRSISERAVSENIGAVFITPYGEAAIHKYYWNAMAKISQIDVIERVGIQTNLSFESSEMLEHFEKAGGLKEKLSLWATFHPEMTCADDFAEKCIMLNDSGVSVCAGAVGVPENISVIKLLRRKLPHEVYLWINKMDGLKRNYTRDEVNSFLSVDPFFENELMMHTAVPEMCEGRCFVEADGKIHTCNISKSKSANWYDKDTALIYSAECIRKNCSCYLAYGGRNDHDELFGSYPVFRQPFRAKAVFFDIEGTIAKDGQRRLSSKVRSIISAVSHMCSIFFVTSMPYEHAALILGKDMSAFSGGACASGGYIFIKDSAEKFEKIIPAEGISPSQIRNIAAENGARISISRSGGEIYKVTLYRRQKWKDEETKMISASVEGNVRVFSEKNCLQIVSDKANKGNAVKYICSHLGISPENTIAFGNDKEDSAMKDVCKFTKISKY